MKIIIAGAGKVGGAVAEILESEGHDVTVLDSSSSRITAASNSLDVICVEGSATDPEALIEAGAQSADLVVAATRSDEMNMVCGIAARKLGTRHVIARIRDPEYLHQTEFLRESLGLSVIINPEYECALEISRILRFPSAVRVDAFSTGSVEIIEHRVTAESKLAGMKLRELPSAFGARVLVAVVERGGEAIIPNGDFVIQSGDMLSITGDTREMRRFFLAIGQYRKRVKNVMILGGGRIAVYLTRILQDSGIRVTVVEKDRARCDALCDAIPDAVISCGDGTTKTVLMEDGIGSADAFVALTGDDGDNIITSLFARSCGVEKIVTKVNRDQYSEILESSGLDCIVNVKTIVSQQIARYVRALSDGAGSRVETLHKLADGKVEALEFKVQDKARCVGIPLKDLKLKPNILVCALIRGGKSIIPGGTTTIEPGDHAIIVTGAGILKDIDAMVEGEG